MIFHSLWHFLCLKWFSLYFIIFLFRFPSLYIPIQILYFQWSFAGLLCACFHLRALCVCTSVLKIDRKRKRKREKMTFVALLRFGSLWSFFNCCWFVVCFYLLSGAKLMAFPLLLKYPAASVQRKNLFRVNAPPHKTSFMSV